MAILGEPDAELVDLLAEIEGIQRAAMKPVKAGVMGGEIYAVGGGAVSPSRSMHNHMHFLAHGMGLVSHEAPRLTATGPVPYDAYDATRPLETGMVVSVETTLHASQARLHQARGHHRRDRHRLRDLRRGRARLEPRRRRAGTLAN